MRTFLRVALPHTEIEEDQGPRDGPVSKGTCCAKQAQNPEFDSQNAQQGGKDK